MSVNGGPFVSVPPNGVIYVANGACSSSYSPFTARYPTTLGSGCGNVYVRGSYSAPLTIAAENDIIVYNNLTRSANGMLGLIANNFVRVYHPFQAQERKGDCSGGNNGANLPTGAPWNAGQPTQIDAAILAIQHSFIVDHYDCGSPLGTLSVNGAIGQKFRGAVGTFSGSTLVSGYQKNYNYDDRLRYVSPPHFLDPVESAWHIQRQTLDYP